MIQQYGLIGFPLGHSFSEKFFKEKFESENINATYKNFPIQHIEDIKNVVEKNHLKGFNITIPHKKNIISYCNELSKEALQIGAVNCVSIRNKMWFGYNTDVIGFEKTFLEFIAPCKTKKALIFGTGGSSKAVLYVLNKYQISFQQVSRNETLETITYSDLSEEIMQTHPILINTTPVGMFPSTDEMLPIPFQYINEYHFVYDLIYNPEKTMLLKIAEKKGASIMNGLSMLEIQAEEAYSLMKK